jgi:Lon protease-like protein
MDVRLRKDFRESLSTWRFFKMASESIIALFPLGVVLLPGMDLPLHIFEERYKKLIDESLEGGREFGVVYYSGKTMLRVGCTAGITRVLRNYNHGEMDILTEGKRRFFIRELLDEKLYIEAKVEFFKDRYEDIDERMRDLLRRGTTSLEQLNVVSNKKTDVQRIEILDPESLSFLIASTEGFTLEEKQKFLEMTSTAERLETSINSLQSIIERLRLSSEIKRIFGTREDSSDSTPL